MLEGQLFRLHATGRLTSAVPTIVDQAAGDKVSTQYSIPRAS